MHICNMCSYSCVGTNIYFYVLGHALICLRRISGTQGVGGWGLVDALMRTSAM